MPRSNPFRPEYRELNPSEKDRIDNIKNKAFELYCMLDIGKRESDMAAAKLEEAVMWAVKGITE